MSEKIGALVMDLISTTLSAEEAELISHPLVGGVILFARNYANPQQLQALCAAIRSARKAPILIMVDQEGGRVQRFVDGFTRIPAMYVIGKLFDQDAAQGLQLAQDTGWLLATELRAVDVDFTLAPILDLYQPVSSVIAQRAFHADPQAVIQLASAFISGMQKAGMYAVGKHFPGHGSVAADSHHSMPIDSRTLAEIKQQDLLPFTMLVKQQIRGILAAHLLFPAVDSVPVGYSAIWLQEILRKDLGFGGCIFSDDLSMEGANISVDYVDRVVAARQAGCDFVLICNQRERVIQVLDRLPHTTHQIDKEKWGWFKSPGLAAKLSYREDPCWQKVSQHLLNLV